MTAGRETDKIAASGGVNSSGRDTAVVTRHETQQMSLIEIAALVAGELEGNGATVIKRAAKIEEAIEGDVTFVANPRYEKYLETTRASAVIVARAACTGRRDVPLVRVDDPILGNAEVPVAPRLLHTVDRGGRG